MTKADKKAKRPRTKTIYMPLDASVATQLEIDADAEKRSTGQQAALIIEKYYGGKLVQAPISVSLA